MSEKKPDTQIGDKPLLANELSELSRQQWEALKTWTFLGVTEEEFQKFAQRRKRIGELAEILSGFKATD